MAEGGEVEIEINKETGFELYSSSSYLRQLKIPWKIRGSGDIVMGIFNKRILKKTKQIRGPYGHITHLLNVPIL